MAKTRKFNARRERARAELAERAGEVDVPVVRQPKGRTVRACRPFRDEEWPAAYPQRHD